MATATTRGRPFAAGTSGNPKGRPVGARNRATLALEVLMEGDATKIVRVVLAAAKNGDLTAARLILDRIAPVPRDRRLAPFDLPVIDTAAAAALAQGVVIAAVAGGELRPSEGEALAGLIELRRRSVESQDFEARLAEIETAIRRTAP